MIVGRVTRPPRGVRLGLRENAGQFALLVLVNAFVGMMVGVERSVLPLLAEEEFGVASTTAALSFLVAFGLTKATANLVAGRYTNRIGRRRMLLLGWLFGLPVPLLLGVAPSWSWVVAANLLLGVNQGLAWSATVIMKIDLVGPKRRGAAMGLNEFAGYLAVAAAALGSGYLAAEFGARAGPMWIGGGAAIAGLLATLLFVRDTTDHVEFELELELGLADSAREPGLAARELAIGRRSHLLPRYRPILAANQAGFVNNLNDGLAWGLFPLYFAASGLGVREIGWLAAVYPAVWSVAQVGTGALSDLIGRRPLIAVGMFVQAGALGVFALASGFFAWVLAAALLGLGTAAVYPTLIAQVSDLVPPRARAGAVGTYRLWRDLGYVAGGLLAGAVADLLGFRAAILAVAALTAVSGIIARWQLPGRRGRAKPADSFERMGAPESALSELGRAALPVR